MAILIPFPDGKSYAVREFGVDLIEFLISPNAGEELKPLRKIASGGELSRIMLALKALISGQEQIPTLVFDEIDTGISGRTGTRIGEKMAQLGTHHQNHLHHAPATDRAPRAPRHFVVSKIQEKKRTLTRVESLSKEGRLDELARLLGGDATSEIARRHAKELLENGTDGSKKPDGGAKKALAYGCYESVQLTWESELFVVLAFSRPLSNRKRDLQIFPQIPKYF